ncbi:hypothetical protein LCGC14_1874870, partial [marine sediment metagenome]
MRNWMPITVSEGTFTSMNGTSHTYSLEDVEGIARNYHADAPAPIVIGHPSTDAPAYGWVDRLYVEKGILKAILKDVVTEFSDSVKNGRYRKISASLFPPHNHANPTPGKWYLKHVGFLGATAPAISGLAPVALAGFGEMVEITFDPQAVNSFSAVETELQELRREKLDMRIDKLVSAGRILPVFQSEIAEFCASQPGADTFSFAGGEPTTGSEWLLSYLERQPQIVSFGAMELDRAPEDKVPGYVPPEGYSVD